MLLAPFVPGNLESFSVLLPGRLLRFVRVMRFILNATEIWVGVQRALKASVGVFLILFVLNLILAMGAHVLFATLAPQYFGDPLVALYSLFKVFTIEGWYEIPQRLAQNPDTGPMMTWMVRFYFVGTVLIGGTLGLSLANAVFVDEMTMDNTHLVEQMVADLRGELTDLHAEAQQAHQARWAELESMLHAIQKTIADRK